MNDVVLDEVRREGLKTQFAVFLVVSCECKLRAVEVEALSEGSRALLDVDVEKPVATASSGSLNPNPLTSQLALVVLVDVVKTERMEVYG